MTLARQVATIATRPDKTKHSLAELTDTVAGTGLASHMPKEDEQTRLGLEPERAATTCRCFAATTSASRSSPMPPQAVVATVAEHHSTYGRQNLLAEAHRMLHGVRFASPDDRVAVAEHIADLAVARSVMLTPPSLHHTPERYVRPDGSSRLRPKSHIVYTTETLLDAEARLLEAARKPAGPAGERRCRGRGRRGEPARARLRAEHRPGTRRREDRHLRTRPRRARRPGRHRQVDRHGGASRRVGGRPTVRGR